MNNLIKLSFLLAIYVLSISGASAEIEICNERNKTIEFSMVWDKGIPIIAPFWKTAGWFKLEPAKCETIVGGHKRQELFLSVRELTSKGPILIHYPLTHQEFYREGMYGVERLFCVKNNNQPFDRIVDRLEELQECPEGWSYQTYNIMVFATARTDFKIRIN